MKIGRTLPPAAAPIPWNNIIKAFFACFSSSAKPVSTFENELKTHFGTKHCFLLSSGKAALTLILQALHELHPDRDEVLIPAFTCFSVPAAVKRAGLKIKLCDLDLETLDFDKELLAEIADKDAAGSRLLCVLPTHLFGIPADIEGCRQSLGNAPHRVIIVEDAAQAMGSESHGKKLGTLGDIGFFSFGRGKALSTMEGGVILTNRDDLGWIIAEKISALPEYSFPEKCTLLLKSLFAKLLQHPSVFWLPLNLPFLHLGETIYKTDFTLKRFSPLQAKLAQNWQSRLVEYQTQRKVNLKNFFNLSENNSQGILFPKQTGEQPLIRLPALVNTTTRREKIVSSATRKGLGIMPAYPLPINEIEELSGYFHGEKFPQAKILSEQLITIPTHEYMKEKDYQNIHRLILTEAR